MNIFVAGATGVIGRPLLKLLRDAGHTVTGTTRSADKLAGIEALGAHGVVADALDAEALRRAVIAAKPEVVIHQLTDLPDVSDPAKMAEVREKNSRVRIEGTRNLMAAAKAAGAAASSRRASPSSTRRGRSRTARPIRSIRARRNAPPSPAWWRWRRRC